MEKKKYEVKIADIDMKIISDEREDVVMKLVSLLDQQINDITSQSRSFSKIDAAILVALDHASNRLKAEKRVRNLEAQIALYDANLRRMREENIKLKNSMLGKVSETAEEIIAEEQLPLESAFEEDEAPAAPAPQAPQEAQAPHSVADLFAETPDEDEEEPAGGKADKLRQIESLLRGN
ncbi:MAG: cell division protein ZapA [Clostridia bacterium]|nr:cell division protein ZapA [Clostridia bacterium]